MVRSSVRVLVGDGFAPFRRLFISKLNETQGMRIVCQASDGVEAVREACELRPNLVLLDIGLPKLNGIEAARLISENAPECKILIIGIESSPALVVAALAAGASGYLVKADAGRELLYAVEQVLDGDVFVSSSVAPSISAHEIRAVRERELVASDTTFAHDRVEPWRYHDVVICQDDASLVNSFAAFIEGALSSGKAAVFIASESHRATVLLRMRDDGLQFRGAIQTGRYIAIDAAETLATIMEGDMPGEVRTAKIMTELVERMLKTTDRGVVACGEMAPTLLTQGRSDAATQLEHLWDKISRRLQMSTLCGYLTNAFQGTEGRSIQERICSKHASVHRA